MPNQVSALTQVDCGNTFNVALSECICEKNGPGGPRISYLDNGLTCCGYANGTQCQATAPPPGGGTGGNTPDPADPVTKPTLDIFGGPTAVDFALLNPLNMFGSPYVKDFSSPAGIINRVLLFAFPLAGLILFVMIVWGGFEVLTGAANTKGVQAGKQRITAALLGFGLLFVSFWIIQIVEYIFNLAIL